MPPARPSFAVVAAELGFLAGVLTEDQRRSAQAIRQATYILAGLSPCEAQVRCMVNDLRRP